MPVPSAIPLALSTTLKATLEMLTYLSSTIQKAIFKRQLDIRGRILPFAWVPVPLALPTPLIAALRALKVGVPFLQRCHTLTVWLRALHQAPIPAEHTQSLLHSQNADPSVLPSLLCMLLTVENVIHMHLCFQARMSDKLQLASYPRL